MSRRTDTEITGEVIAALAASPNVHATDIVVSTQDGLVRLMGAANTLEERDEAERIASGIDGVTDVENNLVISANRGISDREMTDAANAELSAYDDLVRIGARVNAGTAFLMGKAPSVAVENRAIEIVSGVPGVRQVVSEIQIAPGEPIDNITLANDVAETISDDADIDIMDLEVNADDGLVVVTGEVESDRERNLITERASAVAGVQHLQNLVRVHPGTAPSRRPTTSGTEFQSSPIGRGQS